MLTGQELIFDVRSLCQMSSVGSELRHCKTQKATASFFAFGCLPDLKNSWSPNSNSKYFWQPVGQSVACFASLDNIDLAAATQTHTLPTQNFKRNDRSFKTTYVNVSQFEVFLPRHAMHKPHLVLP